MLPEILAELTKEALDPTEDPKLDLYSNEELFLKGRELAKASDYYNALTMFRKLNQRGYNPSEIINVYGSLLNSQFHSKSDDVQRAVIEGIFKTKHLHSAGVIDKKRFANNRKIN